jgi:hypothetical protein
MCAGQTPGTGSVPADVEPSTACVLRPNVRHFSYEAKGRGVKMSVLRPLRQISGSSNQGG